ncbi:HIT domain-containing protein [Brevundimonas bullata]|jgi:diadenosine tetraphosphate (Ap4A) HIT family hydrolase
MTEFTADPAFEAGSVFAADWPLCQVRLQDDARFPWLILLPRVEGAVELDDLTADQRAVLTEEMVRAGEVVRALGQAAGRPVDKLNTAALGNVTRQLHVHVVGRRHDDGLWPDPIWGRPGARPLSADDKDALLRAIRAA